MQSEVSTKSKTKKTGPVFCAELGQMLLFRRKSYVVRRPQKVVGVSSVARSLMGGGTAKGVCCRARWQRATSGNISKNRAAANLRNVLTRPSARVLQIA